MQRIRNILLSLSNEDLSYGLKFPLKLELLTDSHIEAVAGACAPHREALDNLDAELLIFRVARALAIHQPFKTADGQHIALLNARAFCFLTFHITAANTHVLNGRCPYNGTRCDGGTECARASIKYFLMRDVFQDEAKARMTLSQMAAWHHTDFLNFTEIVISSRKRCKTFQNTLLSP